MTDITTLLQIAGVFFTGMGVGITLGFKLASKTITHVDAVCDTPDNAKGYIRMKKIFANGKNYDVACLYLQEKRRCKWTQKRCKYT